MDDRQAIVADLFDQMMFRDVVEDSISLSALEIRLNARHARTGRLIMDVFQGFYQSTPLLREARQIEPAFLLNWAVCAALRMAPATDVTRQWTVHEKYGACMATIAIAEELEDLLDDLSEKLEKICDNATEAERSLQEAGDRMELALGTAGEQNAADYAEMAAQVAESLLNLAVVSAELTAELLIEPLNAAVERAGQQLASEEALMAGWGAGPAEIELMDFAERQALMRRLAKVPLSKWVDLLGRWQAMARAQSARNTDAHDEVFGVELSDRLPDVLAGEFAAVGHPMLNLDFLARLSQSELQSKSFRGVEETGKGPIVLLIDSSGSMGSTDRHGITREAWSKCLMLATLEQAHRQHRDCRVMLFGSRDVRQVFNFFADEPLRLESKMAAASMFLKSGTDYESHLQFGLDMIAADVESNGRRQADIVMVTDDECGVLPAWRRWFVGAREQLGVRMWGVHIGSRQPNDTLASLCDDVRGLDDFLDPGDMADVFRVL